MSADPNFTSGTLEAIRFRRPDETGLEVIRQRIVDAYAGRDLDGTSNGCLGDILNFELHHNRLDFFQIAMKWDVPVSVVGALIADYCMHLQCIGCGNVNHDYDPA